MPYGTSTPTEGTSHDAIPLLIRYYPSYGWMCCGLPGSGAGVPILTLAPWSDGFGWYGWPLPAGYWVGADTAARREIRFLVVVNVAAIAATLVGASRGSSVVTAASAVATAEAMGGGHR